MNNYAFQNAIITIAGTVLENQHERKHWTEIKL